MVDVSYLLSLIAEAQGIGDNDGARALATEAAAHLTGAAPGGVLEQYLAAALLCAASDGSPTHRRVTVSLDSPAVWGMLPKSHPARRNPSVRRAFGRAVNALLRGDAYGGSRKSAAVRRRGQDPRVR